MIFDNSIKIQGKIFFETVFRYSLNPIKDLSVAYFWPTFLSIVETLVIDFWIEIVDNIRRSLSMTLEQP